LLEEFKAVGLRLGRGGGILIDWGHRKSKCIREGKVKRGSAYSCYQLRGKREKTVGHEEKTLQQIPCFVRGGTWGGGIVMEGNEKGCQNKVGADH